MENKKTVMKLRGETLVKVKKNIWKANILYNSHKIAFPKYFSSLNNYSYSFKYINNYKITKHIERTF